MTSPQDKTARLVIIEGKDNRDKGKIIGLKKPYIIIGRGQADIVLNDLQVSRAHVALELNEKTGELTFVDLGSTNGVLVNGELRRTGVLRDRDRLKVGHTVFDCQLKYEAQTEIGTSPQYKSDIQISKSNSLSMAGPSKLSSDSGEVPISPKVNSENESRPTPAKGPYAESAAPNLAKINSQQSFFKKIPPSVRIGALSLLVILILITQLTGSPERSVSNKNLQNYVSEISKLIESNQLDQAKIISLESVKAFPSHSVPMVLLGNVYFEQQKIDLAIDTYRQSLLLKPIQLITYTKLIRLYLIINKKKEAKTLLSEFLPLLESSDSNSKLHINTGELFLDYPELESDKELVIKRARKLQTKDAPNDSMGYKLESNIISISDKSPEGFKRAEELLKKGLTLSPKDEWIFDRLFYLKLATNNSSEAITTLENWIKSNPSSTKPLLLFSYLKFNEKKLLDAIPFLQKIMNLLAKEPTHPHYTEALNLMGNISMQQSQLAEAENFFRQSCQFGYKSSCSHPLLTGLPQTKEARSSQDDSSNTSREPGSAAPKVKTVEK